MRGWYIKTFVILLLLSLLKGILITETYTNSKYAEEKVTISSQISDDLDFWQRITKYLLNEKCEIEEKEKKESENFSKILFYPSFHSFSLIPDLTWKIYTQNWLYQKFYLYKAKHSHHLHILYCFILD
jgi:hypothetical protein